LDGGLTQLLAAQEPKVPAEIVALQFFPRRRLLPFLLVPVEKFHERLPVIPLGIDRRPAVRGQMGEKSPDPAVVAFGGGFDVVFHCRTVYAGAEKNPTLWNVGSVRI